MKKTATITWITYSNFGTYLQAFALQQFIKSLGYENKILDDSNFIYKKFYWKYELKKFFLSFSKSYRMYNKYNKLSMKHYKDFKNKFIDLEYNINNVYLNSQYEIFICGSDQIWRPFLLNRNPNSGFYYASFSHNKKISYAPSIGVSTIPIEFYPKYKEYLKDFSFLSLREEQGIKEIKKITGKHIEQVVDPTLLLSKEEWNRLLPQKNIKNNKYVLCYLLTPNIKYITTARNYAKKHGLIMKMFFNDRTYYYYSDELICAGPLEFLDAIRNADYIFTDSFHGSIFSAIFEKQFITFKRFTDNAQSQNSRVENLLKMFNLPNRLISSNDLDFIEKLQDIDYNTLQKSLNPFIEHSKQYIIKALSE